MIDFIIIAQLNSNLLASHWQSLALLFVAALGLFCVQSTMPMATSPRSQAIKWIGILIMIACGLLVFIQTPLDWEPFLFFAFAGLSLLGGVAFVCSRQPVYAACNFAVSVLSISGLFFLLNAAYLGVTMMIVYAGATIIIFLFVLMFAQRAQLQTHDRALNAPSVAALSCALLIGLLSLGITEQRWEGWLAARPTDLPVRTESIVLREGDSVAVGGENESTAPTPIPIPEMNRLSVVGFGRVLFTEYLWLIDLAGALLTIAAVGAMFIAERRFVPGASESISAKGKGR